MAKSMQVNVGGVWKKATPHVNVNGTWKKVKKGYVNVGGTWKEFLSSNYANAVPRAPRIVHFMEQYIYSTEWGSTAATLRHDTGGSMLSSIAWDGSKFYVLGIASSYGVITWKLFTSPDGITWTLAKTQESATEFPDVSWAIRMVAGPNGQLAMTYPAGGDVHYNRVWVSNNGGLNWTLALTTPNSAAQDVQAFYWNPNAQAFDISVNSTVSGSTLLTNGKFYRVTSGGALMLNRSVKWFQRPLGVFHPATDKLVMAGLMNNYDGYDEIFSYNTVTNSMTLLQNNVYYQPSMLGLDTRDIDFRTYAGDALIAPWQGASGAYAFRITTDDQASFYTRTVAQRAYTGVAMCGCDSSAVVYEVLNGGVSYLYQTQDGWDNNLRTTVSDANTDHFGVAM